MPAPPVRSRRGVSAAEAPAFPFEESQLDRFRDLQQLAYACAARAATRLDADMTERQAAELLQREFFAAGVHGRLRPPFARFGDGTAAGGGAVALRRGPVRRLRPGMPFVLGAVPAAGGCATAVGYSGRFGPNPVWDVLASDLGEYRELVLREVRRGASATELAAAVEALAVRHGYRNPDRALPGGVLGGRIPDPSAVGPADRPGRGSAAFRPYGRRVPFLGRRGPAGPLPPGLWIVTPRLTFRGIGVTFAELLAVTEDSACWLDDDLPHVRRATSGLQQPGGPESRP